VRTIGVVTTGRADFGIYLPVLQAIQKESELRLHLIVTGAHLSPQFGWTVEDITNHGFQIDDRVDMLLAADTPEGIAKSMGLGVIGLAQVYQRVRPDILLVLGDRFEMHAAAVAAVPFKIPMAHIHGGEVTLGAIDDAFRHAITKYSHLHFVSTKEHADRVVQLGEESWRVVVSGAPSLDNLKSVQLMTSAELEAVLDLRLDQPPLLVTYHPVTLQYEQTESQITALLAALDGIDRPMVFTKPNADTNGQIIIGKIDEFARNRPRVKVVDSLGTRGYFSLMKHAAAMVGNSSSGIIEAASFELPVVNVGIRQTGRPRSANVIDVGNQRSEIVAGLECALSADFRERARGVENIYGSGDSATVIVDHLKDVSLGERLILKRFVDQPICDVVQSSGAAA
jgi:UDP-N-acetylglucosamine 2-epimerase (non-hydrolysing)/GDP/UDP-N,N'-diacetylbacillosamine 2-epimerase (hydrolysing)